MSAEEPPCPPGRKPHRERVADIAKLLPPCKSGGICIDDTPVHRSFYLEELKKYPNLRVLSHGPLAAGVYIIKVVQEPGAPSAN